MATSLSSERLQLESSLNLSRRDCASWEAKNSSSEGKIKFLFQEQQRNRKKADDLQALVEVKSKEITRLELIVRALSAEKEKEKNNKISSSSSSHDQDKILSLEFQLAASQKECALRAAQLEEFSSSPSTSSSSSPVDFFHDKSQWDSELSLLRDRELASSQRALLLQHSLDSSTRRIEKLENESANVKIYKAKFENVGELEKQLVAAKEEARKAGFLQVNHEIQEEKIRSSPKLFLFFFLGGHPSLAKNFI